MGRVYRAFQPSVNRVVALKILPSSFETDEQAVRRFAQEAQTAGKLKHPNIVKVWDASVHGPPYYIAMEFLSGGTLSSRLASGPLPVKEAVDIALAMCSALDHAHDRGVIHRDIKPANILFDEDGRPVVTDFGIARALDHTRLTVAGATFGTPDYMSPEQAQGQKLDHRSDLYSAAMVLYETLTGQPPFVNDNPLVTMNQIVHESIPPPSAFGADVPPAVEAVLMWALRKDPDERFQSGAEFARALREALDASHGAIVDQVTPEPLLPSRRRKIVLVGLLSLVMVALVCLVVYSISAFGRSRERPTPTPKVDRPPTLNPGPGKQSGTGGGPATPPTGPHAISPPKPTSPQGASPPTPPGGPRTPGNHAPRGDGLGNGHGGRRSNHRGPGGPGRTRTPPPGGPGSKIKPLPPPEEPFPSPT
jgi:serine/threonine-protein kinase